MKKLEGGTTPEYTQKAASKFLIAARMHPNLQIRMPYLKKIGGMPQTPYWEGTPILRWGD